MNTFDVIVIGAGPAGALSAICAARSGASTLLVERKKFPRAKVCGGCLNASAIGLLESLGLGAIVSNFGLPVDHLHVGIRGRSVRLPLPGGVAIPRTDLDSELVRHATNDGATFLPETRAVLGKDTGSAREVTLSTNGQDRVVQARVVVVASGLGGTTLGNDTSFSSKVARGSRLGAGCVVESYHEAYPQGRISMAVGRSGYVGLTPTIDGLAIASATDVRFLKSWGSPARAATAILEEAGFPPVPAMLSAEWSGTLPLTRSTRPVASSRVFLVGDSAGYVEPFTGQGMAIALQGAATLAPHVARAIAGWSPMIATAWSREYSRTIGSRHWPAALIASIARRPSLSHLAFNLARLVPTVPGALVRIVNRPVLIHSSS